MLGARLGHLRLGVLQNRGQFNIGTDLAQHLAKQILLLYKLEARNKEMCEKLIDWKMVILQNIYTLNRRDAMVRAICLSYASLCQRRTLLPPAPLSPCDAHWCAHTFFCVRNSTTNGRN